MSSGRSLAVLVLAAMTSVSAAQTADHLKCYKMKDPLHLTGTADLDTPQLGLDPGCAISTASLVCVPATKTNVSVTNRSTGGSIAPLPVSGPDPSDRICYKVKCPSAVIPDQPLTDQFGTRSVGPLKASLVCTPAFKGSARFVDNGDGTVTDHYTGLQWETKVAGSGCTHCADDIYTWSSGTNFADGTAFTNFLPRLNDCFSTDAVLLQGGLAGHCDWRLPTITELQTIVDINTPGCGSVLCMDPIFGPTPVNGSFCYWSSTDFDDPDAWLMNFGNGTPEFEVKIYGYAVRGVRG